MSGMKDLNAFIGECVGVTEETLKVEAPHHHSLVATKASIWSALLGSACVGIVRTHTCHKACPRAASETLPRLLHLTDPEWEVVRFTNVYP